ncbi:MAG: GDSL-type esterase/lipase family protein [Bythopirellula sp.]
MALILLHLVASSGADGKEPLLGASQLDLSTYRAAALERWSAAIAALEAKDNTEVHPDDSILFVGSSSIRLWNGIAADMAPYHPIQRGYGGARWTDVAIFAERLIQPHQYRAIVFFVANDITGDGNDRTPQEVVDLVAAVHATARQHNPSAPIFYIAVTPTESRWKAWPRIRAGNSLVRSFCERTDNTHFIGTESIYLDGQRKPRPELFLSDQLHLNRDGYIRWAAAIKSQLDTVLNGVIAK